MVRVVQNVTIKNQKPFRVNCGNAEKSISGENVIWPNLIKAFGSQLIRK